MGFIRIIGYIFCIIWIIASIPFLAYYGISLLWIWAPIVIIIVLRRQAKREVRMEDYEKRQTESLERMSNRSGIINANAHEVLDDDYQNKELESKDEFWVYDKQGKPLMKVSKEDKRPVKAITENLDIDTVNYNKEIEDARKKLAEDQKRLDELEEKKKRKDKLYNYKFDPFKKSGEYVEVKEEKGRKKSKDLTSGLQDASNIAYGASYVTDVQDNDDDYDDED